MRMPGIARPPLPDHLEAARTFVMGLPLAERQPPKPKRQPAQSGKSPLLTAAGVGSQLELQLLHRLQRTGLPQPLTQYPFCPGRKWAADFAYPSHRLLIEVDGGSWVAGRHNRGAGFENDCEKLSHAAMLGYRVIRVTGAQIKSGDAVRWIAQALAATTPPDSRAAAGTEE